MNFMEFFKEHLGDEKYNEILQEAEGKTYEEILDERDELAAHVEELEKENEELRKELEKSRKLEDPVLASVEELDKLTDDLKEEVNKYGTKWLIKNRVEREHREGIPLEGLEIKEG